jgi:hypothetical protein
MDPASDPAGRPVQLIADLRPARPQLAHGRHAAPAARCDEHAQLAGSRRRRAAAPAADAVRAISTRLGSLFRMQRPDQVRESKTKIC